MCCVTAFGLFLFIHNNTLKLSSVSTRISRMPIVIRYHNIYWHLIDFCMHNPLGLDGAICFSLYLGVVPLESDVWLQQLLILSHYTQFRGLPRRSMVKTCLTTPWHMEKEGRRQWFTSGSQTNANSLHGFSYTRLHLQGVNWWVEGLLMWYSWDRVWSVSSSISVSSLHSVSDQNLILTCALVLCYSDLRFVLQAGQAGHLTVLVANLEHCYFHFECMATQKWNEQRFV